MRRIQAMATTGNFRSEELIAHENDCLLPILDNAVAISIGEIAKNIGFERNLPIAIEIRIGEWQVFKAALPGSKPENDGWINRKANVVNLTQHSTMYERVKAEEEGIDWHQKHAVVDATHAIHGGGLALNVTGQGLAGILIVSGLEQVADHMLGVEIVTEYLARQGELQ